MLLLRSKNNMNKANTKISFAIDKVDLFDKENNLQFTSSGHYAIPLKVVSATFLLVFL